MVVANIIGLALAVLLIGSLCGASPMAIIIIFLVALFRKERR